MSLNVSLCHFTLPDRYKPNLGKGTSKTFVGKLIGNNPRTRYKIGSSAGLLEHVIELYSYNCAVREESLDNLEEYSVKLFRFHFIAG